jgi:hypothetical protein
MTTPQLHPCTKIMQSFKNFMKSTQQGTGGFEK